MSPESNQNPLPSMPASPPSMPNYPMLNGQPANSQPPLPPASLSAPSIDLAEQVSLQAKALVEQYRQNPYRLFGALQQLKSKYLADQFHITAKTTEN